MTKFNFGEEAKKAETGSYFKPKEGNNNVRIVSEFLLYESLYQGKKTRKFVGFVIDRADGQVKPAFLAKTVIDQIAMIQFSPDTAFEEVPMPYDINIMAKGAGTIDVEYMVQAARQNTPITEEEKKAIDAAGTVQDFIMTLEESKAAQQDPLADLPPVSSYGPGEVNYPAKAA